MSKVKIEIEDVQDGDKSGVLATVTNGEQTSPILPTARVLSKAEGMSILLAFGLAGIAHEVGADYIELAAGDLNGVTLESKGRFNLPKNPKPTTLAVGEVKDIPAIIASVPGAHNAIDVSASLSANGPVAYDIDGPIALPVDANAN